MEPFRDNVFYLELVNILFTTVALFHRLHCIMQSACMHAYIGIGMQAVCLENPSPCNGLITISRPKELTQLTVTA